MSSTICFNLNQSKILLSGNGLTCRLQIKCGSNSKIGLALPKEKRFGQKSRLTQKDLQTTNSCY